MAEERTELEIALEALYQVPIEEWAYSTMGWSVTRNGIVATITRRGAEVPSFEGERLKPSSEQIYILRLGSTEIVDSASGELRALAEFIRESVERAEQHQTFGAALEYFVKQGDPVPSFKTFTQEQLKQIYDYTKFHIGLYAGTVAATLALAQFQSKATGYIATRFFGVGVLFIVLAGACGGTVLSNIVDATSEYGFWSSEASVDTPVGGVRELRIPGTKLDNWLNWEHRFFWMGLVLLLVGTLFAVNNPPAPEKPTKVQLVSRL